MICNHPTRFIFTLSGIYNILFVLFLLGYVYTSTFPLTYIFVYAMVGLVVASVLKCIGHRTKNLLLSRVPLPLVSFLVGASVIEIIETNLGANTFILFLFLLFSIAIIVLLLLYAVALTKAGDVFGAPAYIAGISIAIIIWLVVISSIMPFLAPILSVFITSLVIIQTGMTTIMLLRSGDVIKL